MKSIKDYLVPTITLFLICFVAALLLGLTNKVTSPKIAIIEEQTKQEAMKAVFPDAKTFGDDEVDDSTGCTYAVAKDENGNVIGYAITATGKGGYSGDIKVMVGVTKDGSVGEIENGAAVKVLDEDETPSVGGKKVIQNSEFFARFIGLKENASIGGGNVDAISGATKTSTGVADAVNNALICYENISEEVGING